MKFWKILLQVQATASSSSTAAAMTPELEQGPVEAVIRSAEGVDEVAQDAELGLGETEEGSEEEAAVVGPSVFVAGKFVPPTEDQKLLDARQLVVLGKARIEEDVDKAAATVSAFARVQNRDKVCASIVRVQNGNKVRIFLPASI
jgi:hypothetical protein